MSSLSRLPFRLRTSLAGFSAKCRMMFTPGLELSPAGVPLQTPDDSGQKSLFDMMNGIWLMAAPKSKVTNMKKKRKHISYIPKSKGWYVCTKCGEPKLPHRICKKHLEVCAMGDEEWEEKKVSVKNESSNE